MNPVLPAAEEIGQASRRMITELDGPVVNAIKDFQLRLGTGRLFERKDEQPRQRRRAAKTCQVLWPRPGRAVARVTLTCRPGIGPSTTFTPAMRRFMIG